MIVDIGQVTGKMDKVIKIFPIELKMKNLMEMSRCFVYPYALSWKPIPISQPDGTNSPNR